MEVLEAIHLRRSVRRFKPEPVPKEVVEAILDAAIWAPSGANIQAWRFYVLSERPMIESVKPFCPGLFAAPPLLVVVCSDLERARKKGGRLAEEVLTLCDISMACQNMMLAAVSFGVGSCVIRSFSQVGLSTMLGLPESLRPELLVTFGYPIRPPITPARRPLSEVVHWVNSEVPENA